MFKAVIISTLFIAAALAAEYEDFENNLIEYESEPIQGFALPYPYQDNRPKRVVALETPTFYRDDYGNTVMVPGISKAAAPMLPAVRKVMSATKLIPSSLSRALNISKAVMTFIFTNGPALLLGTILAFGICKFTPICTALSHMNSLHEVQREIKLFATPERIARATEFVQNAVGKYTSMQDNDK